MFFTALGFFPVRCPVLKSFRSSSHALYDKIGYDVHKLYCILIDKTSWKSNKQLISFFKIKFSIFVTPCKCLLYGCTCLLVLLNFKSKLDYGWEDLKMILNVIFFVEAYSRNLKVKIVIPILLLGKNSAIFISVQASYIVWSLLILLFI